MKIYSLRSGIKPTTLIGTLLTILILGVSYSIVSINNSSKCILAKKYISENKDFAKSAGQLSGFGYWVSHHVEKDRMTSYISLKLIGEKKTIRTRVYFKKVNNGDDWVIDEDKTIRYWNELDLPINSNR